MKKFSDFNSAVEKYPVTYASNPTSSEYVASPTENEQLEGTTPLDMLPAQWWNWLWNLATKDINAFKDYVGNNITELNNLLTMFNISLNDTNTQQLYEFFHDKYIQNYLNTLFVKKAGDTLNGNLQIDGDLHVKGNLSIDGTGEELIKTELKVGANTVTLRNENPSGLGTKELAGIVTTNYDGNNKNNIIAVGSDGVARTGDIDITTRILYSSDGTTFYTDEALTQVATIGTNEEVRDTGGTTTSGVKIYEGITYSNNDTQALMTREDSPTDGAFFKWNATTKKAESQTLGSAITHNVDTAVTASSENLVTSGAVSEALADFNNATRRAEVYTYSDYTVTSYCKISNLTNFNSPYQSFTIHVLSRDAWTNIIVNYYDSTLRFTCQNHGDVYCHVYSYNNELYVERPAWALGLSIEYTMPIGLSLSYYGSSYPSNATLVI